MLNRPIFITGCQRSGTTLLSLILDSHPQIRGIDEMEFTGSRFSEYLDDPGYHPNVMLKLPNYSHHVKSFRELPTSRVIWCIRDPRDTVLSMISLKLSFDGQLSVPWTSHPLGADREIQHCSAFLSNGYKDNLDACLETYQKIRRKPPTARNRKESIYTGALCWKLKNTLLEAYEKEGISHYVIRYEDLVCNPKKAVGMILEYLDLPWHDDVLRHHELHNSRSVGGTVDSRRIDAASIGKWKNNLSKKELSIIQSLCSDVAQKFGYHLSM